MARYPQYPSFIISSQKESLGGFKCQLQWCVQSRPLMIHAGVHCLWWWGECGSVLQLYFAWKESCENRKRFSYLNVAAWDRRGHSS